jgi:hypothetical protein
MAAKSKKARSRRKTRLAHHRAGKTANRRGTFNRFKILLELHPLVELATLSTALYLILSAPHEDSTLKWAFGIVGMLVGRRIRG